MPTLDYPTGNVSKIFEYYYNKAKDASGNLPVIVPKVDQPKKEVQNKFT